MKLRELITEKISFSTYRNDAYNAIEKGIRDGLYDIGQDLIRQPEQHPTYDQVHEFLKTNLAKRITKPIESQLSYLGTKMTTGNFFGVTFATINPHGEAYRDYIQISDRYIDDITKKLVEYLFQSLLDNDAYDSETERLRSTTEAANMFRNERYGNIDDWRIEKTVNDMISTYIHEMVHLQQHSKQPLDKSTEYRSYATKNKKDFDRAIDNVSNGTGSERDWKLYKASPQEIPAFAHQAALDIIHDTMIDGRDATAEDLRYIIEILNEYIKGGKFANEYYNSTMPYYANTFKDPTSHDYKVFKRFMKIVAQELVSYRDQIQEKLNKYTL
jgi:hypothetical protein